MLLTGLPAYNISSIIISTGYKPDFIVSWLGEKFKTIPVKYVHEDEPLGTGGGILNCLKHIQGEYFLALNGDTYFPVDLNALIEYHVRNKDLLTVALKKIESRHRFGSVIIDDNHNIISFHEKKSTGEGLINGGIYVINKNYLEESGFPRKCSFETDIMEKTAGSGRIKGMVFNDIFLDIGVPDDYNKASAIL